VIVRNGKKNLLGLDSPSALWILDWRPPAPELHHQRDGNTKMLKRMWIDFGRSKHGSKKLLRHFDAGQRKGSLGEYFRLWCHRRCRHLHRIEILFQTFNYFIESAMNVAVDCRDECRDISLAHSLIMRILVGPHRSAGLCVQQLEYESYASNQ